MAPDACNTASPPLQTPRFSRPVLLGSGVRLLEQLVPGQLQFEQAEVSYSPLVTHVKYTVRTGTPG